VALTEKKAKEQTTSPAINDIWYPRLRTVKMTVLNAININYFYNVGLMKITAEQVDVQ